MSKRARLEECQDEEILLASASATALGLAPSMAEGMPTKTVRDVLLRSRFGYAAKDMKKIIVLVVEAQLN
jgi:hypothetical protein